MCVVMVCLIVHLCGGGVVSLDDAILGKRGSTGGFGIDVFFAWAVDGDLDCNLTTINVFTIHLGDSLLLEFLRTEGNEAEATTFTWLVAGLELLDHETWDGTESDFGGSWLVG